MQARVAVVSDTLVVNEIYLSLQGESRFAGLPCVFVRTTGCNLRCSYCDTAYAFTEGRRLSFEEVEERVRELAGAYRQPAGTGRLPLVEFTGGEPLLQPGTLPLLKRLVESGYTILLETSGAIDITGVDPRVHRIVDVKCPSSGECAANRWDNLEDLRPADELKFVMGTVEDYEWAKETIQRWDLATRCPVLFSWVEPLTDSQQHESLRAWPSDQFTITRQALAERILADALPVRLQVQLHKIIWDPLTRGV